MSEAAKPVLQVWSELRDGRLLVVSPDSPAAVSAIVSPRVGRLPFRCLSPSAFLQGVQPTNDEQVVMLCRHDQLPSWPAALLAQLPRDPRQLPEHEVLVCCKQGWGTWATVLCAPDDDQLGEALAALVATDSVNYTTQPLRLVSWRVAQGFAVGPAADAKRYFKSLDQPHLKVQTTSVEADRFDGAVPAEAEVVLCLLTYQQWRAFPAALRATLRQVLPSEAAEALETDNDRRVVGAQTCSGARRLAAVIAPEERFFEPVLALGARPADQPQAPWADLAQLAAPRLDGPGDPGGAGELHDLRALRTVVLLAASLDPRNQALATDYALKLRQNFVAAGCFRLIDEQALEESARRRILEEAYGTGVKVTIPGVDAILRLRLHHLERRTEHAHGKRQRLTERPEPFHQPEPQKPDPKSRRWWPFGPRVFPKGETDPKYQEALRQYQIGHQTWERDRDAHQQRLLTMDVLWQQSLLITRSATLDALLEVFGRDSVLLCSVPVRSRVQEVDDQPQQATVRGFEAEPTFRLPPNSEAAPDSLVRQAVDQAAKDTVTRLRYIALMPSDSAAGAAAPRPAPEAGQPGATPGGGQVVKVTGTAPVEGDVDQAKVIARNDACRLAVEQVIGTYVESATVVEKYELLQDRILTRSTGFARVLREVTQERDGDKLKLTCEVQVEHKPLRDQLVGMGLARQWRVMIVVPEQHLRRQVPDPAAENALMRLFIQSGLPVIDKAHSEELRQNKDMLLQIQGNADLARKLKLKYNAEILVVGEAFSQDVDPIAGQSACRARLEIKAIDLNTAEILAAEDEHATGTDQTSELAGKVALRKAAEEVGERFIDMIYRRPMPTAGGARVEITITGFDRFTQAASFKKALAKLSGVSQVRQLEFTEGVLKVEVEIRQENVEELPAELESNESLTEFRLRVKQVTTGTISAMVAQP